MSTQPPKTVCQKLVAFVERELTPWQEEFAAKAPAEPWRVSVSKNQLALIGASLRPKVGRKVIIGPVSPAAASRLADAVGAWDRALNVNHNWHFLEGSLTDQESEGHVITALSRTFHALLTGGPNDHFVIPAAALSTPPPNPATYAERFLALAVGEQYSPNRLAQELTARGYTRHHTTLEPGGFVVRGENIVVAHPFHSIRGTITLWRNTIERIIVGKEDRSVPVNSLKLPPVDFTSATTTWQEYLQQSCVFRPAEYHEANGAQTIVYDAVRPEFTFPFSDHSQDPVTIERKNVYALYQNRDRAEELLKNKDVREVTWCKTDLWATPLCLKTDDSILVSEAYLFPSSTGTRPISYKQGIKLIQELREGKPAVHEDHGIGIYEGLQTKSYGDVPKEYLLLRYAAGDTLAVPVEYAHKVTAYIGQAHPVITRLHSAGWAKTKRAARADAVRFARELLAIASRRAGAERQPYLIDEAAEEKIESSFPYQLTVDQARAWQEVKQDLEQQQVMDRLVVGDVGFGKTEIAIRAAFHVAASDKQVAVLAPTTLLVQQHADTFRRRLPNMANRIGVLSRFSSAREQKETQARIAMGELSIVIGTHALLSEKVNWQKLGLAIIDEEQRFGVKHKEHFKEIRASLDILSLSATPIPRTLSMALSGLKQLSIISSPPAGRKGIITHVGQENDTIIAQALARELQRNGQVYVVAPRVRSLPSLTRRIQDLAPHARIGLAHGQLPERELAEITAKFDAGDIDILVSSSIIENGLDVPGANTIIVMQATNFGLGDLYQLRGRIGRRDRQGYAYFLYSQSELTSLQRQRLVALTETARLGSGWSLAQRDLEIRGAGNLLGAEQSGSVNAIGVQLYLDMVREAAAQQRSGIDRHAVDVQLPLPALIPSHYLADHAARARAYQLLARAPSLDHLEAERREIEKSYGTFPEETNNLYLILQLQHAAAAAGITTIASKTITPPGKKPFERLTVQSSTVPSVAAALSSLGTWRIQEKTLSLDISSITPGVVQKIVRLLC